MDVPKTQAGWGGRERGRKKKSTQMKREKEKVWELK